MNIHRTLLIVDDSLEDRETFRRYLTQDPRCTYSIVESDLGATALTVCQERHFDAILLDYSLPDLNGIEFLQQFQAQSDRPSLAQHPPEHPPIIAVTGQGSESIAVQLMKEGAQDYLIKGQITPKVLQLAINAVVNKTQLQRQMREQLERERLVMQITQQIRRSLNLTEILNTTVRQVRRLLNCDRVIIFQFDETYNGIITTESVGTDVTPILHQQIYDPCFAATWVGPYQAGRVRCIEDIYTDQLEPCHVDLLAQFQVRANLVIPILQDETLWGLLIAHQCKGPRSWKTAEVELLQQLAAQAGIAIQQAELHQQVQFELAERKRTEEALRNSEARFRFTFEQAAVGVSHVSLEGQFLWVNQRFCDITGYSQTELTSLTFQQITHPDDLAADLTQVQQLLAGQLQTYSMEKRYLRKQGSVVWINLTVSLVRDRTNQPLHFIAVIEDISDRKQMELERQQTERLKGELKLLENILEVVLAGYWDWDVPGNQMYYSPAFKRMFGYEDDELPNTLETWQRLIVPEDSLVAQKSLEQHISSRGAIPHCNELRYRHKDGSIVWVICSGCVIEWDQDGQPQRIIGCHIDITQRKQSEHALQQSEARYRAIVEDQTELIVRYLPDSTILFVNNAYCRYFGVQLEDVLNRSYAPLIFEGDRDRVAQLVQSITPTNPLVIIENRVVVNGEIRWTQWVNRMVFDQQGQFLELQAVGRDITALKQTEEALRRSERRYATLAEAAPVTIFRLDPDGHCTYVNERWSDMTGRPIEAALGKGWIETIHPDDRDRILTTWSQSLEQEGVARLEGRCVRPNGQIVSYYCQGLPELDSEGNLVGYIGTLTDITDRKQAEKQLQLQDTVVRTMAEGVCLVRASDGVIVHTNPKFDHLFGYESGELIGQPAAVLNYAGTVADANAIDITYRAMIAAHTECTFELRNVKKDGTPFWCRVMASRFEHPDYGMVYVSVNEDITPRKLLEQELAEKRQILEAELAHNRQLLDAFIASAPVGMCVLDEQLRFTLANKTLATMNGISVAAHIGKTLREIVPDLAQKQADILQTVLTLQETRLNVEIVGETPQYPGVKRTWLVSSFPIYPPTPRSTLLISQPGRASDQTLLSDMQLSRPINIGMVITDITDRKQFEEQLKLSLREKEVLLQEIHHRVKNNLQIIDSLLKMQHRRIQDQPAAAILLESQHRVQSIALVHEKLYRSSDLASISFSDYVRSLASNLLSSYAIDSNKITLTLQIDPLALDIDTAIPCGLIINELVSNALKYAFPGDRAGEIKLEFHANDQGQLLLIVHDDGVGIPGHINLHTTQSLGLKLVRGFAMQLQGSVDISCQPGTRIQIVFPTPHFNDHLDDSLARS
jgi:PAS domain S-box-containing protein